MVKGKEKKEVIEDGVKFSKESILNSKKYVDLQDIISAVWPGDKLLTMAEIDKLVTEFLSRKDR